jgi:hypothetical protein
MAPWVPGQKSVTKGPVTYALDEISVHPDARVLMTKLKEAIEALSPIGYENLEVVLEQYLMRPTLNDPAKSMAAAGYLNQLLFNQKSPDLYFPDEQPIAETFALGVLKCLNESLAGAPDPIPIDAWWLIRYGRFDVINLVTPRQVTLLFASPTPKGKFGSNFWSAMGKAWVTGQSAVATRQVGK